MLQGNLLHPLKLSTSRVSREYQYFAEVRSEHIDSVARNTLLVLRNKRTALDENGSKVPAINWFAEVLFNPEAADKLKTFLIDHDQVLGLLGKKLSVDGKFFSYSELEPFLSEIDSSARESGNVEQEKRDSFDQNIIDLYRSVLLYRKIKTTLSPPDPNLAPDMAEQLQVAEVLYDPNKDKDLTAEYASLSVNLPRNSLLDLKISVWVVPILPKWSSSLTITQG